MKLNAENRRSVNNVEEVSQVRLYFLSIFKISMKIHFSFTQVRTVTNLTCRNSATISTTRHGYDVLEIRYIQNA